MIKKMAGAVVLESQITKEVALHTLKNIRKERYLENYTMGKNAIYAKRQHHPQEDWKYCSYQ